MTPRTARWLVPLAVAAAAGCGVPPSPPPAPTEPVAVVPAVVAPADPDLVKPPPEPAKPADPPVTLPADLGGKAVEKALALPAPLPPDLPSATKPKAYTSAIERGELPLPGVPLRPLAPTPPPVVASKPAPPRERVLLDPSVGELPTGKLTDRPLVKAPSPTNPGAADVPGKAQQQPDRASLADPTADLNAGRIIQTPLPLATADLPFLRLTIPDPFELIEHLKGKLGKDAEFGTKPVEVTPGK